MPSGLGGVKGFATLLDCLSDRPPRIRTGQVPVDFIASLATAPLKAGRALGLEGPEAGEAGFSERSLLRPAW